MHPTPKKMYPHPYQSTLTKVDFNRDAKTNHLDVA